MYPKTKAGFLAAYRGRLLDTHPSVYGPGVKGARASESPLAAFPGRRPNPFRSPANAASGLPWPVAAYRRRHV